jgi:putative acetyltransferase
VVVGGKGVEKLDDEEDEERYALMGSLIRSFEIRDAATLIELFRASVKEIGGRYYSPLQTAVWAAAAPDVSCFERRMAQNRTFLVAEDFSGILAYGDLEQSGHLDHLYCRPDVVGKGVASALYNRLEQAAKDQGIPYIYVDASEAAIQFFKYKGFLVRSRQESAIDGVTIHNYRMLKWLA